MIAEAIEKSTTANSPSPSERTRAVRILARSLYRELHAQGFDPKDVVQLATELLGEVTQKNAPS